MRTEGDLAGVEVIITVSLCRGHRNEHVPNRLAYRPLITLHQYKVGVLLMENLHLICRLSTGMVSVDSLIFAEHSIISGYRRLIKIEAICESFIDFC